MRLEGVTVNPLSCPQISIGFVYKYRINTMFSPYLLLYMHTETYVENDKSKPFTFINNTTTHMETWKHAITVFIRMACFTLNSFARIRNFYLKHIIKHLKSNISSPFHCRTLRREKNRPTTYTGSWPHRIRNQKP